MAKDGRSKTSAENGKKGGRPKGYVALEAEKARQMLVERLGKSWVPIVDKAIKQAEGGDATAREWLTTRGYGKIKDEVELTTTVKNVVVKKASTKGK